MSKPKFVVHSYPVYLSDWRDSETRMRLTLAQRGLLWELIFYAAKEGSLPCDRDSLVKVAGISGREFDRSWAAVRQCFVEVDGRLRHHKVDETLAAMEEYKRKQRESGLSGAKIRWQKDGDPIATLSKKDGDPNGVGMAAAASATATATATAAAASVWPLAAAAIRTPFPETGDHLVSEIVNTALRKDPNLSDEQIAYLATNAWKRKRMKQEGPGLFLKTILEEYERCRVR